MEKLYNKLVKDKIPEIIKGNGENPIIIILNDDGYNKELDLSLGFINISFKKPKLKFNKSCNFIKLC